MSDFTELSAFRGLSPRQRHLLSLEALYSGGRYATVEVNGQQRKSLPWDNDVDPATGNWIPAARRRPMIAPRRSSTAARASSIMYPQKASQAPVRIWTPQSRLI